MRKISIRTNSVPSEEEDSEEAPEGGLEEAQAVEPAGAWEGALDDTADGSGGTDPLVY